MQPTASKAVDEAQVSMEEGTSQQQHSAISAEKRQQEWTMQHVLLPALRCSCYTQLFSGLEVISLAVPLRGWTAKGYPLHDWTAKG